MKNQSTNANGAFRSKHGYTTVQNDIVRDKTVSLKAKGLYLLIQSYITMPDKLWLKSDFLNMVQEGEKAFNSAWNELKTAGYLRTHTYPNHGSWRHEYELLDRAEPGPHTYYYDANGNLSKTNETVRKRQNPNVTEEISETDNSKHYPHYGTSAKGVCAEGYSAEGYSANGTINSNTMSNSFELNTSSNTCDVNPSINQGEMDRRIDEHEAPIIVDVNSPIDTDLESTMSDELRANGRIPLEWAFSPQKMLTAIQVLSGWNAKVVDYSADSLHLSAYGVVVGALTEMCTCLTPQSYGRSRVTYSHVIERMNTLAGRKNGVWGIGECIDSCVDKLIDVEKTKSIKDPVAYSKTMIWNNFATYQLDAEGSFYRNYEANI